MTPRAEREAACASNSSSVRGAVITASSPAQGFSAQSAANIAITGSASAGTRRSLRRATLLTGLNAGTTARPAAGTNASIARAISITSPTTALAVARRPAPRPKNITSST